MSTVEHLALAGIVAVALFVESVTGFGATVIAMTLGSLLVPVHDLLPAYVPVNALLSLWFTARDPRGVDLPLLTRRILPAMLVGFPIGAVGFAVLGRTAGALEAVFGTFVVLVAAHRLGQSRHAAPRPALAPRAATALLGIAGVVHGLLGTGGPLVVLTLAGLDLDKRRFRQTLSALWLTMSMFLVASFALGSALDAHTLRLSLSLLPGLLVGVAVGQVVHHHLDAERFRRVVDGLLVLAGAILVVRTLAAG